MYDVAILEPNLWFAKIDKRLIRIKNETDVLKYYKQKYKPEAKALAILDKQF